MTNRKLHIIDRNAPILTEVRAAFPNRVGTRCQRLVEPYNATAFTSGNLGAMRDRMRREPNACKACVRTLSPN